jgi:hypothetical protein
MGAATGPGGGAGEGGIEMERFIPYFQGRPWVDGMEVIHVYLLPHASIDDELNALAHCRFAFRVSLSH